LAAARHLPPGDEATLDHPLADLACFCVMYQLLAAEGGCLDMDLVPIGIPTQQEFVAWYCRHAGRAVAALPGRWPSAARSPRDSLKKVHADQA
jgi:aminoglycoside phosphotransferase (APT) family kinase protein